MSSTRPTSSLTNYMTIAKKSISPNPMIFKRLWRILFNDKISIRTQLLISFICMTLISTFVTLAICYGILFSMGTNAQDTARDSIIFQTDSNSLTYASQIADALNEELIMLAESVSSAESLYSSALFSNRNILAPELSYREYLFSSKNCSFPQCPLDFKKISGNGRISNQNPIHYGSLTHSSVYLYSSSRNMRASNDTLWDQFTSEEPYINEAINALPYIDLDFQILYNKGPNTTIFFYLSTQIVNKATKSYHSIHRTFPGVPKESPAYDPSIRPWFEDAPIGQYFKYGPYFETFTKELTITISSRVSSTELSKDGRDVYFVAAAVYLVSALSTTISRFDYGDTDCALVDYDSLMVLKWHDNRATVNYVTQTVSTLFELDPKLTTLPIHTEGVYDYTDSDGVKRVVAAVPFFTSTSFKTGISKPSFIVLLFTDKNKIEEPLHLLKHNVEETLWRVVIDTIITVAGTIAVVIGLVLVMILYITRPLDRIRQISEEVVHMTANDEMNRDYALAVKQAGEIQANPDEIGVLVQNYYQVLCFLHSYTIQKQKIPKYPANPFYLGHTAMAATSWRDLFESFPSTELPDPDASLGGFRPKTIRRNSHTHTDSPDVLSRLSRHLSRKFSVGPMWEGADGCEEGRVEEGVFPNNSPPNRDTHTAADKTEVDVDEVILEEGIKREREAKEKSRKRSSLVSVGLFTSLSAQLSLLCGLLLAGLVVVMIITGMRLSSEGTKWLESTSSDLEQTQMESLNRVAAAKGFYVKLFLEQIALDLSVSAAYAVALFDNKTTNASLIHSGRHLRSYSSDVYNKYSANTSYSVDYTGFWNKKYVGCRWKPEGCDASVNDYLTKISSLIDIKFKAYITPATTNRLSGMELGLENGLFRKLPYTSATTWTYPDACTLTGKATPTCLNIYLTSKCANPQAAAYNYYDPRCRDWYQLAVGYGDPNQVYFQYPRYSTVVNSFVVTAVSPLKSGNRLNGTLYGVIDSLSIFQELTENINKLRILHRGYCYLINIAADVSRIILHPKATPTCLFLQCAEGFSDAEFSQFNMTVLQPLRKIVLHSVKQTVADSYTKNGEKWRLSYGFVRFGTVNYVLVSTVPQKDIVEAAVRVERNIAKAILNMVIALIVAMVFFIALLGCFSFSVTKSIISPISDLCHLCRRVVGDDLSVKVDTTASSLDMKVLLNAVANMMIALRFGKENFVRGNVTQAEQVFQEALDLFTETGNLWGIGSAYNNLATAQVSLKEFVKAEKNFEEAIKTAKKLIQTLTTPAEREHAKRLLSDRQGNLAVLYMEKGDFIRAFEILERYTEIDLRDGYIRGCIVKQGNLGHSYLKQGEIMAATRVFQSALDFFDSELLKDRSIDQVEVRASEQIALFNIAVMYDKMGSIQRAEECYIEALTQVPYMHTATATLIFASLRNLKLRTENSREANEISEFVKDYDISIDQISRGGGVTKVVAFALDYSGSMSGLLEDDVDNSSSIKYTKMETAVSNLNKMFRNHIYDHDMVMLLHFNSELSLDVELSEKRHVIEDFVIKAAGLQYPWGETAVYDAIGFCLSQVEAMSKNYASPNQWVVVLTDGDDTSSKMKLEQLVRVLQASKTNLIIVGIGSDVDAALLKRLVTITPKGIYVPANSDKRSIDEAFAQISELIESQVIIEDF